jgi:hypothetical protein
MTGGHRRILVVEDDSETAGQLVEQLTTNPCSWLRRSAQRLSSKH